MAEAHVTSVEDAISDLIAAGCKLAEGRSDAAGTAWEDAVARYRVAANTDEPCDWQLRLEQIRKRHQAEAVKCARHMAESMRAGDWAMAQAGALQLIPLNGLGIELHAPVQQ